MIHDLMKGLPVHADNNCDPDYGDDDAGSSTFL